MMQLRRLGGAFLVVGIGVLLGGSVGAQPLDASVAPARSFSLSNMERNRRADEVIREIQMYADKFRHDVDGEPGERDERVEQVLSDLRNTIQSSVREAEQLRYNAKVGAPLREPLMTSLGRIRDDVIRAYYEGLRCARFRCREIYNRLADSRGWVWWAEDAARPFPIDPPMILQPPQCASCSR